MLFLLKVIITPVLVALVSIAARRWGPTVAALIIGFPWMTGPILFFLGIEHGDAFVARMTVGVLNGTAAIAAYVLAFALVAKRATWPLGLLAGCVAYGFVGYMLNMLGMSLWPAALVGAAGLFAAYLLIPRPSGSIAPPQLPWWDIPMRMLATAALVTLITLSAAFLEPEFIGVVSTFPVVLAVMTTFTHARWGWQPAVLLARGVSLSLLSFVAFFLVVGVTVEQVGLVRSLVLAAMAAFVVSATLVTINRFRAKAPATPSKHAKR